LVLRELLVCDQNPLARQCDILGIFRAVLEFCVSEGATAVQKTDGYVLVSVFQEVWRKDFEPILAEYEPRIDFGVDGIVGVALMRAFPQKFLMAFDRFLEKPSDSFLGQAVISRFVGMSDSDRSLAIREGRMIERVSAATRNATTKTGHLLTLAIKLNDVAEVREDPEWAAFAREVLVPQIGFIQACKKYGGSTPGVIRPLQTVPSVGIVVQSSQFDGELSSSSSSYSDDDGENDGAVVLCDGVVFLPEEQNERQTGEEDDAGQTKEEEDEDEDEDPDALFARILGVKKEPEPEPDRRAEEEDEEEAETEAERQSREMMSQMLSG
jgi:hypothetical protein